MKVLKPSYYDRFSCVGGECVDNCCQGWNIELDKQTYSRYKKVKGEFGKRLTENIKRKRNAEIDKYGVICLDEKGVCPFLGTDGLCDVYRNIDESYLSLTCKIYPRALIRFGDIYERNLYLSCPEIVKYFLEEKDGLSFDMTEENLSELDRTMVNTNDILRYNPKLFHFLWGARDLCISVIQFREIVLWKRLVFVKLAIDKIQARIEAHHYEDYEMLFDGLWAEFLSPTIHQKLDQISPSIQDKVQFSYNILHLLDEIKDGTDTNVQRLTKDFYELLYYNDRKVQKLSRERFAPILNQEQEFEHYIQSHHLEYMFENLIVYLLYYQTPQVMDTRNMTKILHQITISYVFVKMLMLSRWFKNHGELQDVDWIEIFHLYCRLIEHNSIFVDSFSKIMSMDQNNLTAFIILIR